MDFAQKDASNPLIKILEPQPKEPVPEEARIVVHAAVSRFAFLYERIRNAVDYKDEHLLRKSAVNRILGRQLILEVKPEVIANNLVRELIGARYLPNGELPDTMITEVAGRVGKYLAIQQTKIGSEKHLAWLRGLLAVEIEEVLVDLRQEKAIVTYLYEKIADRITVQGAVVDERELRLQLYLACYRTLFKADNETLGFKLLRAYLPDWLRPDDWLADPRGMAERLVEVEKRVRASLTHPLALRFLRVVKPWAVSLNIIRDALTEKPLEAKNLIEKPESLRLAASRLAERRYRQAKGRLRRGAVRATIYLFATKMIMAFALEVPLEYIWYKQVAYFALVINILLPPLLMFTVSLFIRIPGRDNTEKIQANAALLLGDGPIPLREIRVPKKRNLESRILFGFLYAAMFILTFGFIGVMLAALEFTWFSAAIFFFFLCVVSFFAFRLRQNAREFVVVEGKDRIYYLAMDFVSLPVLRAGSWLSRSISRLNVFLFFLDFLVEAPFKIFLTVLEEWFGFMKEKKEELQ
ncbi:MAG: hypothetical protein WC641_03765 [Patescibacteria group bacterium]